MTFEVVTSTLPAVAIHWVSRTSNTLINEVTKAHSNRDHPAWKRIPLDGAALVDGVSPKYAANARSSVQPP